MLGKISKKGSQAKLFAPFGLNICNVITGLISMGLN
ncbi:hypothetical protein N476_22075 [Pseudoalteromonas luteoviolacea H33]|uniref:Uncharacterized protein n=1 Tax=Pseudoalteromonas luteoviolacea H33 TaxID=1365251 RepID=A0A167D1E0_9GAMM|nr:hypothetical protein N476_22075 [Pseudoalteromonas luteoviolacea H33]KZN70045.1 hypothetical protein N477_25970 [Pseudoalteromonas luteoviolacea H33-S]